MTRKHGSRDVLVALGTLENVPAALVGRYDTRFGDEHDGLDYCKCELARVIRAARLGDQSEPDEARPMEEQSE